MDKRINSIDDFLDTFAIDDSHRLNAREIQLVISLAFHFGGISTAEAMVKDVSSARSFAESALESAMGNLKGKF